MIAIVVILCAIGVVMAGLFVGCIFALSQDPYELQARPEIPMHFEPEDGL